MVFKDLPDHLLIVECQNGNVKAFDVLFERYFNKLHHFAIKYLKDRSLAEEMVMDLMAKLWEKRDGFATDVSPGAYLFRALKNAIIDHYRKKSLDTVPLEVIHEDLISVRPTDSHLAFKELQRSYQSSREMLSPQRRLVFEMSRDQQMTYPQIAKQLNLSVKTVESHISAALVYFRKSLRIYTDTLLVVLALSLFL